MSENSDCLPCRLVSGSGLIVAGMYIFHSNKNKKNYTKYIISTCGAGLVLLGFLRMVNLPPFRKNEELIDDKSYVKPPEYIIGQEHLKR